MGSLGDVYIRVLADTKQFKSSISKVKADTTALGRKATEVRIKANTAGAEAQVKALHSNLDALQKRRIMIPIKASGLDADIAKARRDLDALTRKTYEVPIDAQGPIDREIRQVQAKLTRLERQRINIPISLERVADEIAATEAQLSLLEHKRIKIPVDLDIKSREMQQSSMQAVRLLRFPALISGAAVAAGGIAQLTAGFVALTSAIAPAMGSVAAGSGSLLALGQAAGATSISLVGIKDAFKAMSQADAASVSNAAAARAATEANAAARVAAAERIRDAQVRLADAQRNAEVVAENAARRVRDAQESLADAHRNAAEAAEDGARRVRDAEQSLADAQRASRQAQEDLTQARADARRELADLEMSLADASLAEEGAQLALRRAKQRLGEMRGNESASGLDLAEAELSVRRAMQSLVEARRRHKEISVEATEANRVGIEGSAQVLSVKERIAEAERTEQKSAQALARTRQDAARANADALRSEQRASEDLDQVRKDSARATQQAARDIAEAQHDLARAQDAATKSMTRQAASAVKLDQAMSNISPSAREFVQFIHSEMVPAMRRMQFRIQDTFFPKIQEAVKTLRPLLGIFEKGLMGTASALGTMAVQGARMITTGPWKKDFASQLDSNTRVVTTFGKALLPLLDVFRHLSIGAQSLTERFADFVLDLASSAADFLEASRNSGRLARFFNLAGDMAAQLGRIIGNTSGALFDMGRAGFASGQSLLNSLEGATKKAKEFTQSFDGQNKMREYFRNSEATVKETGKLVVALGGSLARLGQNSGLESLLSQMRTQLLPALEGLFTTGASQLGPPLVSMLSDLAGLFERLSAGGGALNSFVGTLDAMLGVLNKLLDSPIGPLINQLLQIAGVGLAFGLVAGTAGRMLSVLDRLTYPVDKLFGKGRLLAWVLGVLRFALLKVGTAVGLLLRALVTNPIGLVVLALVGLGIALWQLYKRNETFRNAVKSAWQAIKSAISGAWNSVIKPALSGFKSFIVDTLWPALKGFGRVIASVFRTAASVVGWAWRSILRPVLGAFGSFLKGVIVPVIKVLWGIWRTVWSAISVAIRLQWYLWIKPILKLLQFFLGRVIVPALRTLLSVAKLVWRGISSAVSWAWNSIIKPVMRAIRSAIGFVGRVFAGLRSTARTVWRGIGDHIETAGKRIGRILRAIKGVIGKVWGKITDVVKAPIRGLFGWINDHLINPINSVTTKINDSLRITALPVNFRDGGAVKGPGTRTSDSVPARLSRDEFVVRASSAAKYGLQAMHAVNSGQATIITSAMGGPWDWTKDRARDVAGAGKWVAGKGADTYRGAKRLVGAGYEALANKVLGPLIGKIRSFVANQGVFSKLPAEAMVRLIEKVIGRSRQADNEVSGASTSGGLTPLLMGLINALGAARSFVLPRGSYRVGVPINGYPGHTGQDFPAPVGTPVYSPINGLLRTTDLGNRSYGKYAQVIGPNGLTFIGAHLSGFAKRSGLVRAGSHIGFVGSTGNSTGPHLHAEFRQFGRVLNPAHFMSYDRGGLMMPGTGGINTSRSPERVLTGRQTSQFDRLISALEGRGDAPAEYHIYLGDKEITQLVDLRVKVANTNTARAALHGRR